MRKMFWIMVLLVGLAVSVQAAPISLQPGPLFIQYNNLEQLDVTLQNSLDVPGTVDYGTAGNWGVLNVSSIQSGAVATPHQDISGGPVYYFDDGPADPFGQGQITGLFYGVNLLSPTTATGGTIDLYWHDAADDFVDANFLNGTSAQPNTATVDQFTSGTFLARLNFMPGILTGNSIVTLMSDINVTAITGTGRAEFFADVDREAGGVWAEALDSNWFYVDTDGDGVFGEVGEQRDLRLATFFNLLAAWDGSTGVVGIRSNDPGRAYVVPEPSTFVLLGAGLLGLAGMARRRNRK